MPDIEKQNQTPNGLIHEKSPYLLQHAHNPVDWHPWGEDAFEKARSEDKPVFLSIGYSTCHWCHVMAHESFSDEEVARLLNDAFVPVKVDREERPDVDGVYMTACQLLTGGGGWPLNLLLTPDKTPFFARTYVPKRSRPGHPGMLELVPKLKEIWRARRDEVTRAAGELAEALQRDASGAGGELGAGTFSKAFDELHARFDAAYGGFNPAPKFPAPHGLTFLLRHWKRSGDARALSMVERTLTQMRLGGIFDHLGGGFHRYATDARWLVPHFEKMLYDQATLVTAYTEAYQATRNPEYEQTARAVLDYVLRDLTSPEGGFYSAEDADSEGEEGKFYVWTEDELRELLEPELAELVIEVYNVKADGNFYEEATGQRTGANILHLQKPIPEVAADRGMPEDDLRARLRQARKHLFEARKRRIRPHKDDKILTDWNGLMVSALSKAAQAFDAPAYAQAAERAVAFVRERLVADDGRLLHRHRDGESTGPAYLDDYAFLIQGLLDLYETSFELDHLKWAVQLNEDVIEKFWDASAGGFFFTPADGEALPARRKDATDGAYPSGNSVQALNLLRLGRMTANPDLEARAWGTLSAFAAIIERAPSAFAQLLQALDFALGPSQEVVIVGEPEAEDTRAMLAALRAAYAPRKVVLLRPVDEEDMQNVSELAPFVGDYVPLDGRATAYVCENFQCQQPTADPERVRQQLSAA